MPILSVEVRIVDQIEAEGKNAPNLLAHCPQPPSLPHLLSIHVVLLKSQIALNPSFKAFVSITPQSHG